jgi:WXG100 family type VII secretion target
MAVSKRIKYDYAQIQSTSNKAGAISNEMDGLIAKMQQRMQLLAGKCKGAEIVAAMRNLDNALPLMKKDANALERVSTETSKAARKMQQTEIENAARIKRVQKR